jgi:hypothetical protein
MKGEKERTEVIEYWMEKAEGFINEMTKLLQT